MLNDSSVHSLFGLVLCAVLGLVPEKELFAGFGHPATFTVACVFVLSFYLKQSGATQLMSHVLLSFRKQSFSYHAALLSLSTFLSMFMNNIGALALLMPIANQCKKQSSSQILMPLSFASILGGLVTLIGTPPNIIIAGFRQSVTGTPFGMFDFTFVGGATALVGLLFFRRFFLRTNDQMSQDHFEIEAYIFQVRLKENASLIGQSLSQADTWGETYNISIVSLITSHQKYTILPKHHTLKEGDVLLLEGSQENIYHMLQQDKLSLISADRDRDEVLHSTTTDIMEVVIGPSSKLHRQYVKHIGFRDNHHVNLLGIYRQGVTYHHHLRTFRLRVGDVLLLHGEIDILHQVIEHLGCLPLNDRSVHFFNAKKAMLAMVIFCSGLFSALFGVLPISMSLLCVVLVFILLQIGSIRDLYQGVDWSIVVLLGCLMPVGHALDINGHDKAAHRLFLLQSVGMPPWVLLGALMAITMTLSDFLNNAATTILMAPIAIHFANGLNASIDPFLMCVAIGASSAFLTPIGHQNNMLIMGPGGYKFQDYWPLGLPLELLVLVVSVPLIYIIWPL